jgi:hypothetical protein
VLRRTVIMLVAVPPFVFGVMPIELNTHWKSLWVDGARSSNVTSPAHTV